MVFVFSYYMYRKTAVRYRKWTNACNVQVHVFSTGTRMDFGAKLIIRLNILHINMYNNYFSLSFSSRRESWSYIYIISIPMYALNRRRNLKGCSLSAVHRPLCIAVSMVLNFTSVRDVNLNNIIFARILFEECRIRP